MSRLDVRGTLPSIVGRTQHLGSVHRLTLRFGEVTLEIRHAPATSRSGTSAFADLTRPSRSMHADEVKNLPLRDVEAVANRVVVFHEQSVAVCFVTTRNDPPIMITGCRSCRESPTRALLATQFGFPFADGKLLATSDRVRLTTCVDQRQDIRRCPESN